MYVTTGLLRAFRVGLPARTASGAPGFQVSPGLTALSSRTHVRGPQPGRAGFGWGLGGQCGDPRAPGGLRSLQQTGQEAGP